jgi:hypothetical protein
MLSRRKALTVALTALAGTAAPALAATKTGPVAHFDADNDGTVDLDEAKRLPAHCSTNSILTRMARSISR